jgi:uridine kinase
MKIDIDDFVDGLNKYIKKLNPKTIIAVSGGGASGKTTFCKKLMERLGIDANNYLNTDSYLIDSSLRKRLFWEGIYNGEKIYGRITACCPEATFLPALIRDINALKRGLPILTIEDHGCPMYSIDPMNSITVIDGIATAFVPVSNFDISIFLHCDTEIEWERRVLRDSSERGIDISSVRNDFYVRRAQFEQYVKPKKEDFNLIL